MTLTYELDLLRAKKNHHAKYLRQRGFRSIVIIHTQKHADTHTQRETHTQTHTLLV